MAASNVLSTGIPCTDPSADQTMEFYSGDDHEKWLPCSHSHDKLIQEDWQSNFVSRVIHIPSNHILSSFNRTNVHEVAQSSSGSSHPLINLQGGQLNGLLIDDLSGIIKNIACECDGFIQVWTYAATPAHGDDYERAASSSSSPNQQLVMSVEINDKNGPLDDYELIINNNTTSVMTPGLISSMFKENDIGKTVMGYVPSALVALLMNTALFPHSALQVLVIAFSLGLTLIWNGIMLGNRFQRFGRAAEKAGVVMVFLGFFGLAASVLPLPLVWAPLLCGLLFLLPFILRVLPAYHCNLLLRTNSSKRNSRRSPLLPITRNN